MFPFNPLVKSTVSWKTTPFRCRSRKIFLARKKTASTFWREKWLFLFWGDLKGQNRWPGQIYSQKDESFLRPLRNTFTRCLTLIPSDKFWRNFLHFDTKELWGTKTIDFQESSKIRVNCFFRQIKLPKKEFWIQANIFESNFTFQANAVWNQKKVFFGRVGARKFCRANAPKKLLLDFTQHFCQHSKPTHFFFHGEPIFYIYSQKDESFLRTLRNIFTHFYL